MAVGAATPVTAAQQGLRHQVQQVMLGGQPGTRQSRCGGSVGALKASRQAGVSQHWRTELERSGASAGIAIAQQLRREARLQVQHLPAAPAVAEWRTVVDFVWVHRDDITGAGFHHALAAE